MKTRVASKIAAKLSKFEHHHSQLVGSRSLFIALFYLLFCYITLYIVIQKQESDRTGIDTRSANVKSLRDRWEVGLTAAIFLIF